MDLLHIPVVTAVEAVLRHVRVIGLATRVQVTCLLHVLFVVVVGLDQAISETECGHCPHHAAPARHSSGGPGDAGVLLV